MSKSPTSLTLDFLRRQGFTVDVAEFMDSQGEHQAGPVPLHRHCGHQGRRADPCGPGDQPDQRLGPDQQGPGLLELAVWLRTGHARFQVFGWTRRGLEWLPKIVELRADQIEPIVVEKPTRRRPQRYKQGELFGTDPIKESKERMLP